MTPKPTPPVRPSLSVVLAVIEEWPQPATAIERLVEQTHEVGGELVLVDGTRTGLPAEIVRRWSNVRCLRAPARSIFQLRALGMEQAHGEIVAVTEDHALVREGWCRRMLDAHRRDPAAAAVGGVVENGSGDTLLDWANFLIANGPYEGPIAAGPASSIALQANVSYKRRVLEAGFGEDGIVHHWYHRELAQSGERLVADPDITVDHIQRGDFWTHARGHFHNARSIAGLRAKKLSPGLRLLHACTTVLLPPLMFARTVRCLIHKKRLHGPELASLPWVAVLLWWHAAGELAGYAVGAGRSPLCVQ